jgi:hypothetical protein
MKIGVLKISQNEIGEDGDWDLDIRLDFWKVTLFMIWIKLITTLSLMAIFVIIAVILSMVI